MSSLEQDTKSGRYRLRFRYGGTAYKRSLKTKDKRHAELVLARVEETIGLLERGRLELPPDADPGTFILTDGKLREKPKAPKVRTLGDLFRIYRERLPEGAKEPTTLKTEETYIGHLLRHLGTSKAVRTVTASDLQGYVERRLQDRYREKPIRPDTVKKEVATFRLVWNWGVTQGFVAGPAPVRGIVYPKTDQKPPFMTSDEIGRIINRGGLTPEQEAELWSTLFLTKSEIQKLLDNVKGKARHDFICPMIVFAAHTGARRSELLRSRIDDFDFAARSVLVREKKRSHEKSLTYRRVPMTDLLLKTMTEWFDQHPGGPYTICADLPARRGKSRESHAPLTRSEAHDHFKRTLRGSRWGKIRGFHVLRHSFCSNLAAAGVDERLIQEWMGHMSEETSRRYRHLFPDQQQRAIDSVFGGNGK